MSLQPINLGRASALPFSAVLGAIPSYPRPVIERLVARLIERLDEQDGDTDLEDDDPGEAEPDAEPDNDGDCGEHGIDQRRVIHWGGTFTDL